MDEGGEESMKRNYILLDVGGTEIKGGILDEEGNEVINISSFPAMSRENEEMIIGNFVSVIATLLEKVPLKSVVGVALAFPGPFDYEHGRSLMKGIGKYDSIYGMSLEEKIKEKLPEIQRVSFRFLHDVEAFGVGECYFGQASKDKKIFCLCIGTGAGTVFLNNQMPQKSLEEGVPKNGWIYDTPYKESIIDDYISVRGLEKICDKIYGQIKTGKELAALSETGDIRAQKVWKLFGEDLCDAIVPFLDSFRPDAVVLGGQISKSFALFGEKFEKECEKRNIKVYVEVQTSIRTMQGLLISAREQE